MNYLIKLIAISELMVKYHLKIVKLINDVEKNRDHGKSRIIKIFNNFVCSLEKRLFTEENAIFTSYYKPTNTKYNKTFYNQGNKCGYGIFF